MATKEVVTKVWIDEGCIVCDACEATCPDVFDVQEENCFIRPEAMTLDFTKPRTQDIEDAAEECPVDVIKFETVTVEVADEEPVAVERASASTGVSEPPEAAAEVPDAVEKPQASPRSVEKEKSAASAEKSATAAKPAATGASDPSIAALLRAATARGGEAGIRKSEASVPRDVGGWRGKDPSELPPDARQAKVLAATKAARQDPDADRRKLLSKAALTVGWVAFGTGAGVSIGPAFARFMMPNALEEPDPRVRVGKLKRYMEMVSGDVIEDYKPQGIWMIRDGDRIAALSIICTHLGCIPNWLPNDRKFKCPCHGSGYKPDGVNFEGPTPRPLERFRIYQQDGVIVVDKSKKYQYELGQWDQTGSFLEV